MPSSLETRAKNPQKEGKKKKKRKRFTERPPLRKKGKGRSPEHSSFSAPQGEGAVKRLSHKRREEKKRKKDQLHILHLLKKKRGKGGTRGAPHSLLIL